MKSKMTNKKSLPAKEEKDKETLYERCVCCKRLTKVLKTQNVEYRDCYVEGSGQLCRDCYDSVYHRQRGTEHDRG